MWYDKLGVISIGVQNGGPEDGGLGDIKIDLEPSMHTARLVLSYKFGHPHH